MRGARIREMVGKVAAKDTRFVPDTRDGLTGYEEAAWMAFRLAVIKLGEMGRTRDWIAARLGVAPATLNDWVTPAGQTVARVTALGTAMGLLTPELRALVASELLSAFGLRVEVGAPEAKPVAEQALECGAAAGRVSEAVRCAIAAGGPEGAVLTPAERAEIARAAEHLAQEAGQLAATAAERAEIARPTQAALESARCH